MNNDKSARRKLILLFASVIILVVALTGTTIAYFTDSVANHHVITVGSVDAEQYINGSVNLATDGYFIPAVKQGSNKVTLSANNGKSYEIDEYANSKDRVVTVENTGTSNAYFRTLIAVERLNKADDASVNRSVAVLNNVGYDIAVFDNVIIDGGSFTVYVATYTDVLLPGEISEASLLNVYLDPQTTSEDAAGVSVLDLTIITQAAQAGGFSSAEEALNTSFAELTDANIAAQFD